MGGQMYWILLDKHPILMTILTALPFMAGFVILNARKPINHEEKKTAVRSTRLKVGDEVQVIHTEGDPESDDWKFDTRFGRVTRSLDNEERYQPISHYGDKEHKHNTAKDMWEIEFDDD